MNAALSILFGIILAGAVVYFFYYGTDEIETPLFDEERCRSEAFRECTQCQLNGNADDCSVYGNDLFERCAAAGYIESPKEENLIDYSNTIDCSKYIDSPGQT